MNLQQALSSPRATIKMVLQNIFHPWSTDSALPLLPVQLITFAHYVMNRILRLKKEPPLQEHCLSTGKERRLGLR